MSISVGRRRLGQAALLAAAVGLPGRAAQAATALRWMWWGNPERDRRTNAVLALYRAQHAELALSGESAGWGDYWPKLATQIAGRRGPDVIQMDYRYLVEYARRGALLPLDGLIPDPLDLAGFDASETDGGKVEGKLYGVSVGANAYSVQCSAEAFARAGIALPAEGWSWADFEAAATSLAKSGPKDFYGAADGSRSDDIFERAMRQRGKQLFTEDGRIGFTAEDAAAFFSYWAGLRRKGVVTPAAVTATDQGELRTSLLVTGKAAMAFHHSNQLAGVQALMQDRAVLADIPAAAAHGPTGNYLKPSQLMSVWAKSPAPREAAALIRFVLADPEAVRVQGIERGVPSSEALRRMMEPSLGPVDAAIARFISMAAKVAGPLPPAPPKGGGEFNTLLPRVADQVAFGQLSEVAGGQTLVDSLADLLKHA